MVDSDKFVIGNIQTIKKDMQTTWSGYASDELCTSLGNAIKAIAKVKLQLNNFDGALALLEKYKEKKQYNNYVVWGTIVVLAFVAFFMYQSLFLPQIDLDGKKKIVLNYKVEKRRNK